MVLNSYKNFIMNQSSMGTTRVLTLQKFAAEWSLLNEFVYEDTNRERPFLLINSIDSDHLFHPLDVQPEHL